MRSAKGRCRSWMTEALGPKKGVGADQRRRKAVGEQVEASLMCVRNVPIEEGRDQT